MSQHTPTPTTSIINTTAEVSAPGNNNAASIPDEIPSDRSIRNAGRAQIKSTDRFRSLLRDTDSNFLNVDVRNASEVQTSLNQALYDCEQYIKLLSVRIDHGDDHQDDKDYFVTIRDSCQRTKEEIPKQYADRLEQLGSQQDLQRQYEPPLPAKDNLPPDPSGDKSLSSSQRNKRALDAEQRLRQLQLEEAQDRQRQEEDQQRLAQELRRRQEEEKRRKEEEHRRQAEEKDAADRRRAREKEMQQLQQEIESVNSDNDSWYTIDSSSNNKHSTNNQGNPNGPANPTGVIYNNNNGNGILTNNNFINDINRIDPHLPGRDAMAGNRPYDNYPADTLQNTALPQTSQVGAPNNMINNNVFNNPSLYANQQGNGSAPCNSHPQTPNNLQYNWLPQSSQPQVGTPYNINPNYNNMAHVSSQHTMLDKFLRLSVMDKRCIKFDGDPLQYIPFRNEFNQLISSFPDDPHYLFHELLASLQGPALKSVVFCRNLLGKPDRNLALNTALDVLERNFGSSYQVRRAHLKKITDRSRKVQWDEASMRDFLGELEECSTLLESPAQRAYLDAPETVMAIVDRLPAQSKRGFHSACVNMTHGDPSNPGFGFLLNFVKRELAARQVIFADLLANDSYQPKNQYWKNKGNRNQGMYSRSNAAHDTESNVYAGQAGPREGEMALKKCHYCQQLGHRMQDCSGFNNISVEERWEFIRKHGNICKACFGIHDHKHCRSRYVCKHCRKGDHHSKLCQNESHDDNSASFSAVISEAEPTIDEKSTSPSSSESCSASGYKYPVFVRVVPLVVSSTKGSGSSVIYALLDSGSDTTLGTTTLKDTLKLHGKPLKLSLQGVNDHKTINAVNISISVKGTHEGADTFNLDSVVCVPSLPSHCRSIPSNSITSRHTHLQDINFPEVTSDRIDLIIGADNEHLHAVLESRLSPDSRLNAYRTPLGWVLAGTDDQYATASVGTVYASTYFTATSNRVLQSDGVTDISDYAMKAVREMVHQCVEEKTDENQADSVEDEEVIKLFQSKYKKDEENHICLPLPLKDKNVVIPNNRSLAESRMKSLRCRLMKDPKLLQLYISKMNELIEKRYMKNVPLNAQLKNTIDEMVVYIVYFMTQQAKPRLVFDAAATHLGRSLNSYLMQGPDLVQPLVDVLIRFRQDCIAFACDIQQMFHQVRFPSDSNISLRLLWFKDNDPQKELIEYEFSVHAFGLKSSPAAANFSVRQTALDNESEASPATVETMLKQLYVDDCLNSEPTVEEALTRINEINELAATSSFKFVKYTSNSKEVLDNLDSNLLLPELRDLNLRHDGIPTHKALGVYWDPASDCLTFRIDVNSKPETRRGLLSMLSQIFDPLGLALPYLMSGRKIMQEAFACSDADDWDSPLPDWIRKKWHAWLKYLSQLELVSIPRCYHVHGDRADHYEVHTFGDASNIGIGAVSFLRYHKDGSWNCAFIRGKGHVLPKDVNWATARHELEAAVMATHLHTNVLEALDLPLDRSVLWSDSATVLSWIRNTVRRPKVFVYNRRREILRHSNISQWRYVNTAHNPADLASRGVPTRKISNDSLWLKGPEFLCKPEEDWPDWSLPKVNKEDLELLPEPIVAATEANVTESGSQVSHPLTPSDKLNELLWKFSSLDKLLRVIARLSTLSAKEKPENLSPIHLEAALMDTVLLAQQEFFTPHIILKIKSDGFTNTLDGCKDKVMKERLKPLQKLSPYVDENGLFRVGGRLQHANIPFDTMHPIILPRRHHVTRLIIEDCHVRGKHFGGVQYTLNILKNQFWITQSMVRFYLDRCLHCQIIRAKTGEQMMAPLPADRVASGNSPFTATGVDYFGPILVKVKRSNMKRWVALFTCMATRAIHLEKVHSLTTSSFLQAFFRFRDSRGGNVKTLYSDNATTFHGADAELKKAVQRLEAEGFGEKLLQKGVNWKFNPPLASHQGGVWERQIRSVRKVLLGIPAFESQVPTDELLDTVLKEAECVVNNRPLTQIDGDADSIPALTPNMFLTGLLDPAAPIDAVHNSEQYKRDWKFTQVAADQFWQRFVKEYLLNLQPRSKWYKSYPNLKVGDVVLVKEVRFNHRPNYPKAIILKLNIGSDGLVRSTQLRFADGRTMVRDIRKVVPLECTHTADVGLLSTAANDKQ